MEKYISFFASINDRSPNGDAYAYERCALLIVDFNRKQPLLFSNSKELKQFGYLSESFNIEYESLSFKNFAKDILQAYDSRHGIHNLQIVNEHFYNTCYNSKP